MRDDFLRIIWGWLGWPYVWGAQSPIRGFDCSGLIIAAFLAIGLTKKDMSSATMWKFFAPQRVRYPYAGTLIFWEDKRGAIKHVEVCVGEDSESEPLCVGARQSKKRVVISRLIERRSNLIRSGYVDPFMNIEYRMETNV